MGRHRRPVQAAPQDGETDDPVAEAFDRAHDHLDRHRERFDDRRERHQERIDRAVQRGRGVPVRAGARRRAAALEGVVTVVCTDIVGSTRYADTLGDQRWRSVLQTHNALVREQLAAHGGTEIKTNGDGFLVTFASARRAVQFAVDVQDRLADYRTAHPETPLEVRIGLHAGEVERDGNDVVGRNVSLACRLCDAARPRRGAGVVGRGRPGRLGQRPGLRVALEHRLAGIERPVTALDRPPPLTTPLRRREVAVTEVPCPGSAADVDTVEDLHRWS